MSGKPAQSKSVAGSVAPSDDDRSVAARLFAIVDAFTTPSAVAALSLTAIALRAGLPLSTTHRLVAEWVTWGGLTRQDDGRYALGMRLWEVGVQTPTAHNLRTIALPYLEDLYEASHEHVHLAIRDGRDALYVEKLSGHHAVRVISRVGGRLPLHSTGVGLVLLAYAPTDVILDYLASDLQRFLPQTVTDPASLRRRLAAIRLEGLASMSEEMTIGSSSLAAPIRDRTGQVVAAVSVVTGTGDRSSPHHEHAVRQAARGISRAFGYRRASS
ncbi:IclR family transcriptional regulator [Cryobacterium levicorallinum]|uniref:IclR family transcriptional regulator n=1 Tax=Cryobacterium levicorallinum TaxID=995038 RepID=A0A1I3A0N5_9MICO|nr:IclR family transcriptional regulator [Cryobacterium levicorallinum]TFB82769.1 IclR family transcriptional regulator [Cryobacterium levicorallinum]GEP26473.1 IclR family transcriptional regulator [Cryobacterium levicorallinum]SFH42881.1 transcriptional regulator, IclR family [Cryobacterium levicorallinum]